MLDDLKEIIVIVSPVETLESIARLIDDEKKGAYMRFGDGDVYLALGQNEMLQKANPQLSLEMKEAFSLKGNGIIKALAIHSKQYGLENEMFEGNHLQNDEISNILVRYAFPFFVGYQIYSPVALHYMASYFPEKANYFLKKIKKHAILFIGNENTPLDIIGKLFGNVTHVKTPAKNSYNQIDMIEEEAFKVLHTKKEYGVVIIAMGCSGRVLMKRLFKNDFPVFYFDFGSLLDGISGEITRPWLKVKIDYEKLLCGL